MVWLVRIVVTQVLRLKNHYDIVIWSCEKILSKFLHFQGLFNLGRHVFATAGDGFGFFMSNQASQTFHQICISTLIPSCLQSRPACLGERRNIKGMLSGRNGPWQKEL